MLYNVSPNLKHAFRKALLSKVQSGGYAWEWIYEEVNEFVCMIDSCDQLIKVAKISKILANIP